MLSHKMLKEAKWLNSKVDLPKLIDLAQATTLALVSILINLKIISIGLKTKCLPLRRR